jgi:hypothetical protein
MAPQSLAPITPGHLLRRLFAVLVPMPVGRVPAVIKRRRV